MGGEGWRWNEGKGKDSEGMKDLKDGEGRCCRYRMERD